MEIIFIPKGKSEDLINYSLEEIKSVELEQIKKELEDIDKDYELKCENFGIGADWIMVLAILNGLTTVFLLGDKIDKGIEGWIKISNRLKNIFSKTDRTYLDMEAAKLLGINHISNNIKIESLRVVMEAELPIKDLSGMLTDRKQKDFISKPFCVYFITFEVNDNLLIALGVRSDGEIKEQYSFDKNDFIPF